MSRLLGWRMRHPGQAIMIAWRAAHGSGGWPPPAASRSLRSLLSAATPAGVRRRALYALVRHDRRTITARVRVPQAHARNV